VSGANRGSHRRTPAWRAQLDKQLAYFGFCRLGHHGMQRRLRSLIEIFAKLASSLWVLALGMLLTLALARWHWQRADTPMAVNIAIGLLFLLLLAVWLQRRFWVSQPTPASTDAMPSLAERTAELEAREAVLARAQSLAKIGSYVAIDGEIAYFSAEICHVLGIAEGTALSRQALMHLLDPADRERLRAAERASYEGSPYELELRIVVGTETRWIRLLAAPAVDAKTGQRRVVGCIQDISAERLTEKHLRETNARLEALIEALPQAVFFKDGDSRWLVTNAAAKQMFQLHDVDWQGKTDRELAVLQPNFRDIHEACLLDDNKTWHAATSLLFDEFLVHGNGQARQFEVRKVPLFETDGRRKALVVVATDVTERKRAEAELLIAAALFESQEAMLVTNADRLILRVNKAFTQLTGYSAEEAVGQLPSLLKSGCQDDAFYAALWQRLLATGNWRGRIRDRRKNGEIFTAWLSISAVAWGECETANYVATLTELQPALGNPQ